MLEIKFKVILVTRARRPEIGNTHSIHSDFNVDSQLESDIDKNFLPRNFKRSFNCDDLNRSDRSKTTSKYNENRESFIIAVRPVSDIHLSE